MSEARRTVLRAAALVLASVVVGTVVHFPLVKRFLHGEFRESFFEASRFPGVRLISLQEAEDLWSSGQVTILDARAAGLFRDGHVPGARNIPPEELGQGFPAWVLVMPREATLVVYCEGGACRSSLDLAERLHQAGFQDIRVLIGGWEEWARAGLPEEKGDVQE